MLVIARQRTSPRAVGSRKESTVHFLLPVSFFIVASVVPQGKCSSVKMSVQTAVSQVQPFSTSKTRSC